MIDDDDHDHDDDDDDDDDDDGGIKHQIIRFELKSLFGSIPAASWYSFNRWKSTFLRLTLTRCCASAVKHPQPIFDPLTTLKHLDPQPKNKV